jgi:hypothetical protein
MTDPHAYGMGDPARDLDDASMSDDQLVETEEDDMANVMKHRCEGCGEMNGVLPPRGYRLAKSPVAFAEAATVFRESYKASPKATDALAAFRESYREVAR